MLQENDTAGMKAFCEHLHPATVAEALADDFSVEEDWRFLSQTSIRHQAAIFEYFPLEWQVKMVEGAGRPQMARLIEQMSHDDRADLLRRLRPRVAESLLRLVDEADRRDIATLVSHKENSAGALMTTDYAWVPADITVTDALDRLRLQAPDRETIYYVFVLAPDRKLLGVLSLRDLILAPRHALIRDVMDTEPVAVRVTDDRELVARELAHYDLLAIPVVDEQGRLVGIVTHDDVIDVVVEEATEDVHRLGGVGPLAENYLEANFVTIWRKRAVWLACLFIAELFTFTALSYFDEAINEVVVLALFVPLCISTGGNSGSQAATLITRAIALGQVRVRDWVRVLRHELVLGIALGLTLGAIGFVRGFLTPEDVRGNLAKRNYEFHIQASKAAVQVREEDKGFWFWEKNVLTVSFPKGVEQRSTVEKSMQVILPEGEQPTFRDVSPTEQVITFPPDSEIRYEAVHRFSLAMVITQAVALICLWGTLVGSMLPIIFKRLGVDPGIASSPFVATFVDVTGIVIYFSIAKIWLLP
jgi:magnesium transporter